MYLLQCFTLEKNLGGQNKSWLINNFYFVVLKVRLKFTETSKTSELKKIEHKH